MASNRDTTGAVTPTPDFPVTKAANDVLAERWRQATGRWSTDHDDSHPHGELAQAAAVYALCREGPPKPREASELYQSRRWDFNILGAIWPRDWHFNPKDRRTNLVRAAALLLAEIERLDRAERIAGVEVLPAGVTPSPEGFGKLDIELPAAGLTRLAQTTRGVMASGELKEKSRG